MSGSTVGGVVGGLVGFWVGGPTGAQWGWMIGSGIGGYVDPETVKNQGPRITDAAQQTARDGVPITIGYGTFPTSGNIIWRGPLVENVITTTERQGKGGGPEVETTTYQYTRSYAMGICEGPKAGLLIVRENGQIVYDARTDAELTAIGYDAAQISQTRGGSAAWLAAGVTIFLGTEDQLPWSVMEAHVGTGNAVPFRGLMYIGRENHDLTDFRGAIPQIDYVVVSEADEIDGNGSPQWMTTNGIYTSGSPDAVTWQEADDPGLVAGTARGVSLAWGNGILVKYNGTSEVLSFSNDRGENWFPSADDLNTGGNGETAAVKYVDGKFFMAHAGGASETAYSENGNSWTVVNSPTVQSLNCVGGHSGVVVMGTNNGTVIRSTDGGATWSGDIAALGSSDIRDIASDGARLIAVGGSTAMAMSTNNGASWSYVGTPFASGTVRRVRYAANLGLWVAMTNSVIGFSEDGVAWSLSAHTGTFNDLDASADLFVIVGASGADPAIWTSTDGNTWTLRTDTYPGGANPISGVVSMPCSGTAIPGAPGWTVNPDGSLCGPAGALLDRDRIVLGSIVADICDRQGLAEDEYDVSELTDLLDGYRIATTGDGATFIGPLMAGYFFDVSEWDGKLRFVKRGQASKATLTMDDLAEREGDTFEQVRIQEAELLRKETISYIDPLATYTVTTQQHERRSTTVLAKGEGAIEMPVVTDSTSAVQMVEKRIKVAWSETDKALFALPNKFSRFTPTDVITIIDDEDTPHRVRLMKCEEDSGYVHCEAVRDRQPAYIGTVTGTAPSVPPGQTPPPLRGPTIARAMNLPFLRTVEQTPGIYIAATGLLPSWIGADIYISVDGGETEQFAVRILSRAIMGNLIDSITASSEPISVDLMDNRDLESISDSQIAAGMNVAAITTDDVSEVIQFQTAVETSAGDWELYDVGRGELLTLDVAHNAGDGFTLLDQAVVFVPISTRYAGVELIIRPVSIGTVPEENETFTLVYDPQEYVLDGNGETPPPPVDEEDPDEGGAGTPGSPTPRTIGATVEDPCDYGAHPTASASVNSTAWNDAFDALPGGGGTVRPSILGTYQINTANPILVIDNSRLELPSGVRLKAAYSSTTTRPATHRDIVRVENATQWEICGGGGSAGGGGSMRGYRDEWAANGGVSAFGVSEWAHGIYVATNATFGTIYDLTFDKFVGDGISIGRFANNIHVVNVFSTNNRRQGISTGGDDILIEDTECSYIGGSDGTSPMAGIDIEVDSPDINTATNVTLRRCHLHHNTRTGLTVYKSCNNITVEDCDIVDNVTHGIYAEDSDNVDIHDCRIKWNGVFGVTLNGSTSNWDFDGCDFFSNKTRQYNRVTSGSTTTSPTTTQKARHFTQESSVTGTTFGTNTWGPV